MSGSAAPGPRVLLHPHRLHRPLPADAGPRGLLPDGLGRQRPQRRAAGPAATGTRCDPSLPYDPDFRPPEKSARRTADPDQPAQLRRAVRRGRRAAGGDLLRPVVRHRPVGRLEPHLPHDRARGDAGQPAGVPAAAGPGPGVPVRGARPCGTSTSAPRSPRPSSRTARSPAPTTSSGSEGPTAGRPVDRHHPARAAAGVRRRRRPPRRRALPAAVRPHGHHAAVRRGGADRRPRAGRPREGHRHRHDLHVRRHHRRHVVARAAASASAPSSTATAGCGRSRGARPAGSPSTPSAAQAGLRRAGRHARSSRPRPASSSCWPSRATCRARPGPSPTRSSSGRTAPGRSRSSPPTSGSSATRTRTPCWPGARSWPGGPDFMRVRYENWVNGLHGDWNITRQRFFGVPFPVWYPIDDEGTVDWLSPILAPAGGPAGRPDGRRPAGLRRVAAQPARRVRRRPRRDGHVGHVVADPADRHRLGRRPRPVRAHVPDGHAAPGPRDHPHLALLHGRPVPLRARRAAVVERRHLRVRLRPRPQEAVQVGRQRAGRPHGPDRDLRRRRGPVLGGGRAAGHGPGARARTR